MDGVSLISQCPILPYTSFRYEVKPEREGTYFYHAHSGMTLHLLLYSCYVLLSKFCMEVEWRQIETKN